MLKNSSNVPGNFLNLGKSDSKIVPVFLIKVKCKGFHTYPFKDIGGGPEVLMVFEKT